MNLQKFIGKFNISKHNDSKNNGTKQNKHRAKIAKASRCQNRRKK